MHDFLNTYFEIPRYDLVSLLLASKSGNKQIAVRSADTEATVLVRSYYSLQFIIFTME